MGKTTKARNNYVRIISASLLRPFFKKSLARKLIEALFSAASIFDVVMVASFGVSSFLVDDDCTFAPFDFNVAEDKPVRRKETMRVSCRHEVRQGERNRLLRMMTMVMIGSGMMA
jgi:hypothetical protein